MHDVFLSPATFLAHLSQERSIATKKQTPYKMSEGYWANSSKNLKNSGKAWEILEKHGKYWKSMGNTGKAWEIPRRHGKSPKSIGNPGITWEIPVKHVKSREILGKQKNLRKWSFGPPELISKEFLFPALNKESLADLKVLKIWSFEISRLSKFVKASLNLTKFFSYFRCI